LDEQPTRSQEVRIGERPTVRLYPAHIQFEDLVEPRGRAKKPVSDPGQRFGLTLKRAHDLVILHPGRIPGPGGLLDENDDARATDDENQQPDTRSRPSMVRQGAPPLDVTHGW
jgi:hypothetical protein